MLTKGKDLSIVLEDRPGTLVKVAEALASAGINIDGIAGAAESGDTVHFLFIRDAARAREALRSAGHSVKKERDVAVVEIEDRPGALAAKLSKIAEQKANVDLLYLATNGRLVIGGQDIQRISEILSAEPTQAPR